MTPDEYRAKWKLPADYPMVAPNYAAQRSEMAKRFGLGQLRGDGVKRKDGRPRKETA
jgi:predicted transcriptional regulator